MSPLESSAAAANPPISSWLDTLVANWMPGDPYHPHDGARAWLQSKYDVALRLQPAFICEIGVRAGYSAFAMLSACPTARYLGIDIRTDTQYGGFIGAHEHAAKLLADPHVELLHADSQQIDRLPPMIDLLHIDGDHSFGGALTDMHTALRSRVQWMLLDDVDHLADVRLACETFAAANRLWWEHIDDGHRGSALFDLRQLYA